MIKFKEECLKENTVVHLRTQEQYNIFIKWLDSINERFWNGDSYMSKNNWEYYKQDTCLYPHKGFYEEVYLFEDEGYKILSYEKALLEEPLKLESKEFEMGLSVKPNFNLEEESLQFNISYRGIMEKSFTEYICFKNDCVRKALIGLGWTPPKENK